MRYGDARLSDARSWHPRYVRDREKPRCPNCGKNDTGLWLNYPGRCWCFKCGHKWNDDDLTVPTWVLNPIFAESER